MTDNNDYRIVGTIYDKQINEWDKGDKHYFKYVITLEVEPKRKDYTFTRDNKDGTTDTKVRSAKEKDKNLPQFEAFMINMDDYDIGDTVEVKFYLVGQPWTNKEGKRVIFTRNSITFIKHADLDADRPTNIGKITVDDPKPPKKDSFPQADPDEGIDQLPF
jgi:hypothetical protein